MLSSVCVNRGHAVVTSHPALYCNSTSGHVMCTEETDLSERPRFGQLVAVWGAPSHSRVERGTPGPACAQQQSLISLGTGQAAKGSPLGRKEER